MTRIKQIELKNLKLTNRICALENKMLEANIILHGIKEAPWETEEARQEKVYDAVQETMMGRSYDEKL